MPSGGGSNQRFIPGLTAGVSLTAAQYKVVKFASTANAVIAVAATTDIAVGIIQNNPGAGDPALVAEAGEVLALAGANNLAAGNNLGYNTTGQVVAHTTDNRMSIGHALEPSTAIGDIVRIMLYGGGSQRY
jgi:phosphoribosylformylglycinamidine (FGAM) synthase-like enzyme